MLSAVKHNKQQVVPKSVEWLQRLSEIQNYYCTVYFALRTFKICYTWFKIFLLTIKDLQVIEREKEYNRLQRLYVWIIKLIHYLTWVPFKILYTSTFGKYSGYCFSTVNSLKPVIFTIFLIQNYIKIWSTSALLNLSRSNIYVLYILIPYLNKKLITNIHTQWK